MSQMKAVRIHTYGGPEVLSYEEAPRPEPGPGEVLIRVLATTVNPVDCAFRAGYMVSFFNHTLPLILGIDAAGIIAEVGLGVDTFQPGDHVYARGGVYRDGTYAEYVVVSATDVAASPLSLDTAHIAAIPHVTLTAWQALFEQAELTSGQTVLIHGAAGGVGHAAVQLAQWKGARVIGTASANIDFLHELHVDQAINYATTPFENVVESVDVVLDLVGGEYQERSCKVLKPNGMLVSTIQAPSEEMATAYGVRQSMVYATPPIGETLAKVADLVDAGHFKPYVSSILPLEDVASAHEMLESRHTRGKIVLEVTPTTH